MGKTVWKFGLIGAAILAFGLSVTAMFHDHIDGTTGFIWGYTMMLVSFLMVYFGVRSYRDESLNGTIRFGQAARMGLLIALVASAGYVGSWEVIFRTMVPDFADKYAASAIAKAKSSGKPEAEIAKTEQMWTSYATNYQKPLYRMAYTTVEVLPVGLLVVLVSAGVLSRKKRVAA